MTPAERAQLEAHAAEAERLAAALRAVLATPEPPAPALVVDRWLTVAEAAAVLRVSPRFLYNRAERLPFMHRRGSRMWRANEAEMRVYTARK